MANRVRIGIVEAAQAELNFSGSYYAKSKKSTIKGSYGYAHRSEKIKNTENTRFGIASGTKIFTSVAICQLVDLGKITFQTKLNECLAGDFPYFDEDITIHHLLTHTSGVPDYFDEDKMDDYEELWVSTPMYHMRTLHDFLPLFQNEKMKSAVGTPFTYNNSGYIILGLIVERVSGFSFTDYVERFIFKDAGMNHSGFFEMDDLPDSVALGYIEKPDGSWKTNIYSVPAKGGSDGGAYVTAKEMSCFWEALMSNQLLSKGMTKKLLTPRVEVDTTKNIHYGYSGYMEMEANKSNVKKFILMGYDPGVNFRGVYYPATGLTISVCSNKPDGAFEMLKIIDESIGSQS